MVNDFAFILMIVVGGAVGGVLGVFFCWDTPLFGWQVSPTFFNDACDVVDRTVPLSCVRMSTALETISSVVLWCIYCCCDGPMANGFVLGWTFLRSHVASDCWE